MPPSGSYLTVDLFSSVSVYIQLMFQFWFCYSIDKNYNVFDEFGIFYG